MGGENSFPILGILGFPLTRDEQLSAASQNLLNEAKLIAARQQRIAASADAILTGLMQHPDLRRGVSAEACSRIFAAIPQEEAAFVQAGMTQPDGVVACSAVPAEGEVSLADRDWFQQALQSHGMVVSEVLQGRVIKRPSIVFAKARRDEAGRVAAVFYLGLNLEWLHRQLAAAGLPEGARLVVVDAEGILAVRYPDPEGWVGKSVESLPLWRAIQAAGGEGVDEHRGVDGVQRISGFTPLLDTVSGRMTLWLGVPKAQVQARAQRRLWLGFALALAVLVATLGLTLVGGDRLVVRPLLALSRAAERLRAGEIGVRSGLPHTADEIGRLARTLDEAAATLEDRERRLARALAERERQARQTSLILASAGEGIFGLDIEGRATFVNPAGAAMLQWTAEELLGQIMHELHHHTRADGTPYPREACPVYAAYRDGVAHRVADEVFWRKDGTSFPVEYVATPIRDERGEPAGAVVSFSDISERKQAEAALRASEAQLHAIVENLTEGLAISDLDGRLLHFNRAALNLHGFATLEESRRRLPEFADTFELSAPDGTVLPPGEWPLARILRGENLRDTELGIRHLHAGWQKVFEYGGTLVRAAAGEPLMAIVTIRDVTEKKRMGRELEDYRQHLEKLVAERTAKLERLLAERQDFLATVSHEIRTPLSGLLGMLELLSLSNLSVD